MAERYASAGAGQSEVEYTKKHIAGLSGLPNGVEYNTDFVLPTSERERKVPVVQIPVVKPPQPTVSSSTGAPSSSSTAGGAGGTTEPSDNQLSLTIKSLKPPLTFTLPCSMTKTISELKGALYAGHKDQGAPEPERQRWLLKGKAMADERLLKEYDGIKDGDTVHLSIKAATAGSAAAPMTTAAAPGPAPEAAQPPLIPPDLPPLNTSMSSDSKQPASTSTAAGTSNKLATPFSPGTMGPPRPRTTSSSSLAAGDASSSARRGHSRVPSITLTTDASNFNNLAGNATSPTHSQSPRHSRSSSLIGVPEGAEPSLADPFTVTMSPVGGSGAGPSSPSAHPRSGDSTPLSTPGTPMSGIVGYGRTKSPSISIPLDLDNLDFINPISSDRKNPVGLTPAFVETIKDPQVWNGLLEFLQARFDKKAANGSGSGGKDTPMNGQDKEGSADEWSEETKRVFETWLGASKDWMNASDIARIRDSTGLWGMAGR